MVGLPADFPVEKVQIVDCYPAEERAFAADVILKTMVERGRWSGETYFRHWQTEKAIPVSDEHFMIRDPGGERVLGMGTVTRDITERKRAEEALRFSEARFSGIISISADAIISIDEDQRILSSTTARRKSSAIRAPRRSGPPWMSSSPRGPAVHRQHVARFAAGPTTSRQMGERLATIMGRRKNGEEFPAEAAISRLHVDGHTILTVALRDITERKRVEKEQRFLAEAGAVLASSLDYEQTLTTLGQLVVRDFADWCIVDIVEDGNRPQAAQGRQRARQPGGARGPAGARCRSIGVGPTSPGRSLETRRPFLIERMTPEELETFAQSAEHLRLLRAIDPRSVMGLPLLIRGELLGVLVLISSTPSRGTGRPIFAWPRRWRSARRWRSRTDACTGRRCTPPSFETRCSASSPTT